MATRYYIQIKTGDHFKAGTDAGIFITLCGSRGTSSEVRLNGYICSSVPGHFRVSP